jgi:hypothetical protein
MLQAAKRRAVAELIFFAGTNDVWRCKQLAGTWNINVSIMRSGMRCSTGSHDAWHAGWRHAHGALGSFPASM